MDRKEALFYRVEWLPRDGGGVYADVPGLGRIEIHRTNTKLVGFQEGWCVDINGERHSSAYKEGLRGAQFRMSQEIREWVYLNSFMPKP